MKSRRRLLFTASRLFSSTLAGLLAALLLTQTAWGGRPAPAGPSQEAGDEQQAWRSQLEAYIAKALEAGFAPGLAVAVVREDEVLLLKGFGHADLEGRRAARADTIFYIASSTKSFTGLLAAILAHRGRLDLDAAISRYHSGLRLASPLSADEITLRQLLTHTHGIDNDGPVTFRSAYSGQQTPELLAQLLQHHQPAAQGRNFRYGNIGYNVAGLVLSQESGKSWKDLLQEEIFGPLGMDDTSAYLSRIDAKRLAMPYRLRPDGFERADYSKNDSNMHAAGGLVTTARDLSRWLRANLGHGRLEDRQALPEQAFRQAHQGHVTADSSRGGPFAPLQYGLGWNLSDYEGHRMIHHFGGYLGFHSHISFMPEEKIGVAVLANEAGPGSLLAGLVARMAYESLLERPRAGERLEEELQAGISRLGQFKDSIAADLNRRAQRPQELPRPLKDYAGTYESPVMGRVELALAGEGLEMRMGRIRSKVEVYDGQKHALRIEVGGRGQVAVFEFEGEGPASVIEVSGTRFRRVSDSRQ